MEEFDAFSGTRKTIVNPYDKLLSDISSKSLAQEILEQSIEKLKTK